MKVRGLQKSPATQILPVENIAKRKERVNSARGVVYGNAGRPHRALDWPRGHGEQVAALLNLLRESLGRGFVPVLFFCCAAYCGLPATPALGANAVAHAVALEQAGDRTILTIRLSRPAQYTVVTLPDPYRIVVDLSHVDFDLPVDAGGTATGVVKAYRFGQFAAGKARLVIDTEGPAEVRSSEAAHTSDGAEVRLVLAATTERAFGKTYRRRKRREAIARQDAAAWEAIAEPVKRAKGSKKVIIIDPGHGGIDSGAIAPNKVLEKHVVLAFSRQLRRSLLASGKYIVHMTRSSDAFVSLRKRVEFARRHDADLFISVHADSVPSQKYAAISGTTVYTLSDKGSDAAAREIAKRENQSDVLAGVDVLDQSDELASILIDLTQRETNARSERFARVALGQLRKATRLSRGAHRSAAFAVLKAPDIPSVLIELGYLSNSTDTAKLQSAAWRASVARSITRSVSRYFAQQGKVRPY